MSLSSRPCLRVKVTAPLAVAFTSAPASLTREKAPVVVLMLPSLTKVLDGIPVPVISSPPITFQISPVPDVVLTEVILAFPLAVVPVIVFS